MFHILLILVASASALQFSSRAGPEDVCRRQAENHVALDCCPIKKDIYKTYPGGRASNRLRPPQPPPELKLRVILAEPCSGSSAVEAIAMDLLKLADVHMAECNGHGEVLKDLEKGRDDISGLILYQNYSLQPEQMADYLKVLMDANSAVGRSILIKDPDYRFLTNAAVANLARENGKATMFVRTNHIDSLLCEIKDGMDVLGCGGSSELGTCASCGKFRGRGEKQSDTSAGDKVTINTEKLLEALWETSSGLNDKAVRTYYLFRESNANFTYNLAGGDLTGTRANGCESHALPGEDFDVKEFLKQQKLVHSYSHYEKLFAFEWNSDLLEQSVAEWQKFLAQLGSDIHLATIRSYLESFNGSYSHASHTELIENYLDVKMALSKCEEHYPSAWCENVQAMLRE